jgi:hypothetical protein
MNQALATMPHPKDGGNHAAIHRQLGEITQLA